jgi:hypothetical protein
MDEQTPNYRGEFLRSPHHGAWALATVGIGFLSATALGLLAGTTLYTLAWICLPDFSFFRNWVDRRHGAAQQADKAKKRYLGSRLERLEVLRKRQQRVQQAQENFDLVVSEQDRLDQQIKLIRADAVATKNAESLTARIDATVEHLDQTNKWLSELDEFKDLVPDMPATQARVGYASVVPPPVIEPARPAQAQGAKRSSSRYN